MLFKVTGRNFASNIYDLSYQAENIKQLLIGSGIGINYVASLPASSTFTGYREFLIDVITAPNESRSRVIGLLYQFLPIELTELNVTYISDSDIADVNAINPQDAKDFNDLLKGVGAGLGLSTPVVVGLGFLLLILYLKKINL